MNRITVRPMAPEPFAAFGNVLDNSGAPDRMINQGLCGRFHDRARLEFGKDGRAGISVFDAKARSLPYRLEMMERHPEGSQTFVPMTANPFLVIVAADRGGVPELPLAFVTAPHQAINIRANTWHGVLTPLQAPGLFAVIDRIGPTPNLEEYWFSDPYVVTF